MSKNKVVTIFSVFLVFFLFIAMKPGDNPVILMRIASIAAVIVFVAMILYTRVLWRVAPFSKLHSVVDIGGKWQGKLTVGEDISYDINVNISQNLDDIKVKLITSDFSSDSLVCKMKHDFQGTHLYVVYRCKPNGRLDSKDKIEYGTLIIECDEVFLEGKFYSSAGVSGKVELYRK